MCVCALYSLVLAMFKGLSTKYTRIISLELERENKMYARNIKQSLSFNSNVLTMLYRKLSCFLGGECLDVHVVPELGLFSMSTYSVTVCIIVEPFRSPYLSCMVFPVVGNNVRLNRILVRVFLHGRHGHQQNT